MRKKDTSIQIVGIPKGGVEAEAKRLITVPDEGQVIVASGAGNLPDWAEPDGIKLWQGADQSERKTGLACQEVILTLPQGINLDQSQLLVQQFVKEEVGTKAYEFSIFANYDGNEPTVAKLLVSGRVQDGINRDRDHFFRRYRTALPAFSGAKKDGAGKVRGKLSDPELTRLQNWKRMSAEALLPKLPKAVKKK